jgi:zinc transport system substrate-binding protein
MRIIPKKMVASVGVAVTVTLAACAGSPAPAATMVAPLFPVSAVGAALVGDHGSVVDLTPPGVEPHDLEATTRVVDAVLDARVAVLIGDGFQPAVESAASRREGPTVDLLRELDAGPDPHVWLDPVLMGRVTTVVERALRDAGEGEPGLAARADRVRADLRDLDAEYRAGLADCDRRVVVTAHDAFGRLAERYGLRAESIAGISPEQEPDPRRVGELADLVRREGVTTVFTERAVSPRVARTLAREAGVRTVVLDPLETPPEGAGRITGIGPYVRSMRANLGALQSALGCRAG